MQKAKLVLAALAVAAMASLLAACGSSGGTSTASNGDSEHSTAGDISAVKFTGSIEAGLPVCFPKPKQKEDLAIGFASPIQAVEGISVVSKAMELEAAALGGSASVIDAEANVDKQVSAVEQFIAQKVDAIVVLPLDNKALNPVVAQAKDAGIPVIAIESNMESTDPGPGYASQIWYRRDEIGYLQARKAAQLLEPGATVALLKYAVPVPALEKQVERAEYWAKKFGLNVVVGHSNNPTNDIAGGEQAMAQLLASNPDLAGVIAYNEGAAIGAGLAARAQGRDDLALIGSNGAALGRSAVKSGKIAATTQVDDPSIARCSVWGAYDVVQGEKVPPAVLAGPPRLLDSETIGEVPTWDETLTARYGTSE